MAPSILSLAPPPIAFPHGEEPTGTVAWSWEPSVIVGVALFAGIYVLATGPLRHRLPGSGPLQRSQRLFFFAGTAIFLLALVSPLEDLSDDYLFSAHMVQHILITMIAPPLWLLGMPAWLFNPLVRRPLISTVGRVLTHPFPAFLLFNTVFWLWHWPALYDLAVASEPIHIIQHLSLVATAVINWWPVLGPPPQVPSLRDPARAFYLFACCQPGVALGAILVFSRDVLYTAYLDAPRLLDLSPYSDQQLGGLIMWIPGNGIYLLALTVVFIRWISGKAGGAKAESNV